MIVSNASTLILLAKVSLLRRFLEKYKDVVIPEEVLKEVTRNDSFDAKLLKRVIEEKRITVTKTNTDIRVILEEFRLDRGEAEVYALYNDTKADIILTDDGELIKLCKIFEIPFVNALAVVTNMFERGILTKEQTCEYLEKLYDYGRYSMDVYNYFIKEVDC